MLVADWERDRDTCTHCGQSRAVCGDPEVTFYPQRSICYADRERVAAMHAYDRLHDKQPYHDGTYATWAEHPSTSHPYRYDDGVTVFASTVDADPDDDFLTNVNAVPTGRPSEPEPAEGA